MNSKMKLDKIDIKILNALIKDARAKLKEIASDCGLSSNAIFKRIKHLKERGVIVGTTLYPDARKFGFTHIATMVVNLEYAQEHEIVEFIKDLAKGNLIEISSSICGYDLTAFMLAKSLQELDNITQKIRKQQGVRRVAVNIWVSQPYLLLENFDLK